MRRLDNALATIKAGTGGRDGLAPFSCAEGAGRARSIWIMPLGRLPNCGGMGINAPVYEGTKRKSRGPVVPEKRSAGESIGQDNALGGLELPYAV
ncbi:hypothetical protein AGMMS50268_35690 [Spirochaetia bacterium]|nr:hypothetical protein AGMMS50268_35690 [Spirochaetia bacterium]